jgi:hypothetical protein
VSTDRVYRRARLRGPTPPGARDDDQTWGQIVTPDELERLLGLSPEDAARAAELVQITIEAYIWPNVIEDPIPPPVHAVGLALAARFSGATLTKAGSVVGESIGAYSYRLAGPLTFDDVVLLLGELAEALYPRAPPRHDNAYTLEGWTTIAWPAEWWQRDLDNLDLERRTPWQ